LTVPAPALFVTDHFIIRNKATRRVSFDIDFDWWRDAGGYDLVLDCAQEGDPDEMGYQEWLASLVDGNAAVRGLIKGRGGGLVKCRPIDQDPGLYRRFARCTSVDSLLAFVNKFGLLTVDGKTGDAEAVTTGLSHAETMSNALSATASGQLAAFLTRHGQRGLAWSRLDVDLWFNQRTRQAAFRLKPPTLINALWLQCGQAICGDARLASCGYCGELFEAGPGTGRRNDAKFCSNEHRILYNSRKRTRKD
jgi:hypothetical protein